MAVYFLNKHVKQLEGRPTIKYRPAYQSMFLEKSRNKEQKCQKVSPSCWEIRPIFNK